MKSTEFLMENPMSDQEMDDYLEYKKEMRKYANLIHKHCQPFLQQIKNPKDDILFRGMNINADFIKKNVRLSNRIPVDMPDDVHKKLNQYFTMKYGAPFRNALFVTGDYDIAIEYGNVYAIFPIGNFKFLWSEHVHDLLNAWNEYDNGFDPETYDPTDMHDVKQKEEYKQYLKQFYTEILKAGYKTKDLRKAIKSGHEIMLRCKSYYAVNYDIFDDVVSELNEK